MARMLNTKLDSPPYMLDLFLWDFRLFPEQPLLRATNVETLSTFGMCFKHPEAHSRKGVPAVF
jgi:hypothetical protein